MKRPMRLAALTIVGLAALQTSAWAADDLVGNWQRSDGTSRIRMAPCSGGICGTVTWLKNPDSPGKVGQQVFFGMKPDGAGSWSGSAFNPEDGKTYSGKATVSGASLTTKGCALGGLVCKTASWSRM